MQRWAEEMIGGLDELLAERGDLGPVVALRPLGEAREPGWRNIEIRTVGRNAGHVWEQLDLYAESRSGVLVNLLSSAPLMHPRMIVTFHDAAVFRHPEHFSRAYRTFHRLLRPALARRAKGLVTVSRFSAGELSELLRIPLDRFAIAPNAASHITRPEAQLEVLSQYGLQKGRYIFCVGNQTPNKNLSAAIRAFQQLGDETLQLVIVGAPSTTVFGDVDLTEQPRVVRTGYISDGQLRALYENAAMLCFPSRYEGFGIPVLEAMTLGCPVVASNTSSLPEVAGEAALLVDPDQPQLIAAAMQKLLDAPSLTQNLRAKGLERAKDFTWRRSAQILSDTIMKVKTKNTACRP
jgi:glycosyltransferase involved in cell wall biosynthesis